MSRSKWFLIFSLVFLLANLGWLWWWDKDPNPDFAFGQNYDFRARIVRLDKKINGWQVVVAPQDLAHYQGRIILYLPLYPEYEYGDILSLRCRLSAPEPLLDERGREFYYNQYLAKDKIRAICSWPQVELAGQSKDAAYYFFQVKKYLWRNLNNNLVEPASSLAKAMLLASSREVSSDVNVAFARVGLSHVIAISGMHMVVIAWLVNAVLISLGFNRKKALWLVLGFILFYLFLTGLPGSAVRSVIMLFLVLGGQWLGRASQSFYTLLWSADIIVLFNPYVLLYDIGWQLSFLAVLGLLCYGKFFHKILFFLPEWLAIREICALTLAAQVFTTPLIVYYFGIFSLVAPLANLLIVPLSTVTLILSMGLGVLGSWPFVSDLLSWPLFVLLKIMTVTAQYLSSWPGAYWPVGLFPPYYLLIAWAGIFLLTWWLKPYRYE